MVDESRTQECVGIGEKAYMTVVRTKIDATLDGSLVYSLDVWVGYNATQEARMGMHFMVPVCVCLNLADGTLCLPNDFWICSSGRMPPYRSNLSSINRSI